MSLQANQKGVSEVIGYVILIAVAISMGAIVYAWVKSYTPSDVVACPDGVSIAVKDFQYDCNTSLNITIENTGRFSLTGYFIHAKNSSGQEIATIDLTPYLNETFYGHQLNSWISFYGTVDNSFPPGQNIPQVFTLPTVNGKKMFGNITSVELIAARYDTSNNKYRFVTCTDSEITQDFIC